MGHEGFAILVGIGPILGFLLVFALLIWWIEGPPKDGEP